MQFSGIIAFLASAVGSRFINERAYKGLSDAEKLRLMDGFSQSRAYSLIPLLALLAIYWGLVTKTDLDRGIVSVTYFGLLLAYVAFRVFSNSSKLRALDMPDEYRKLFAGSQVLSLVGLAWFVFAMLQGAGSP